MKRNIVFRMMEGVLVTSMLLLLSPTEAYGENFELTRVETGDPSDDIEIVENGEPIEGLGIEDESLSVNDLEEEGNGSSAQNAVDIEYEKYYTKTWYANQGREVHFCKVVVPQKGFLTIFATKPTTVSNYYKQIQFSLYDSSNSLVWGNCSRQAMDDASDKYTIFVGLNPGTYYLTMKPYWGIPSGGVISTTYQFKFEAYDYSESEPNESVGNADVFDGKHIYYGFFGNDNAFGTEENDYWVANLTKDKLYRLYVSNYGEISSTSAILEIKGPTGDQVKAKDSYQYINFEIADRADEDGDNYVDFYAPYDGRYTFRLYNYSGRQFLYGIGVVDIEEVRKDVIRSFVTRMYTVAMGRDAEEEGLNYWSNKLISKESDGASLARGFICSGEFKNKGLNDEQYVDTLYRTFFDREGDPDGKNGWIRALANGTTRESVLAGFVNSAEFGALCDSYGIARGTMEQDGSNIYNAGVREFVLRNYEMALGREGETAGVEDWSHKINTGEMSALDVAQSFFHSQEFLNKNTSNEDYVEILYATFLGRASDYAGKRDWVRQLNSGTDRDTIMRGFAYSQEFRNIMAQYGL